MLLTYAYNMIVLYTEQKGTMLTQSHAGLDRFEVIQPNQKCLGVGVGTAVNRHKTCIARFLGRLEERTPTWCKVGLSLLFAIPGYIFLSAYL